MHVDPITLAVLLIVAVVAGVVAGGGILIAVGVAIMRAQFKQQQPTG